MFTRSNRRSGFTLPEVLVTVAIVAVLAAVVVPAVTQQISKGDDSNFTQSTGNFRTAITSFVADTRKFPGKVADLYSKPAATDKDAFGNDYGASAVAAWNGPYHIGSYNATNGTDIALGAINDSLVALTALDATNHPDVDINTLTSFLKIASEARRLHADSLIDHGDGATTGDLKWTATATDTTVVYKVMPAR